MTAQEILAEIVAKLNNDLAYANPQDRIIEDGDVTLPIFWSEDVNGNINFDVESIINNFNELIYKLEEHNENTDFDWDNF